MGAYAVMNNQTKKSKFIFHTSFIDYKDETVPLQITAYSDNEAVEKYKNNVCYLDLDKCKSVPRILEEEDLEYFEQYTYHFYHLKSSQIEVIKNLLKLKDAKKLEAYLKSVNIDDKDYQAKKHRFYASQYIFDKLNIEPKNQKYCEIESDDFYGMNIIDDKYLIGYDGGYVIVFTKSKEPQREQHKEDEEEIIKNDTFTSPITTETHNFIPDDFFIKK